jgi:hypothetical protein
MHWLLNGNMKTLEHIALPRGICSVALKWGRSRREPEILSTSHFMPFRAVFYEAALHEAGPENLLSVLEKFGLSLSVIEKDSLENLDDVPGPCL